MAISLFETRTMLEVLEQMLPARQFLLDTFFPTVETSVTEDVDIDIIKGKRKLAPFVRPIEQGKVVERMGYTTKSLKPPYIKMKMKSTAQDFLKRGVGTTIYQGASSPAARAAQQQGKDLAYLQDLITRREEWMASQLLDTGKVTITGDGINAEVDFVMLSSHKITLAGAALWTDAASDPIKNLRTWSRLIQDDSGLVPNICVMGMDAADAFLDNAKVQKLLDLRRVELGQINPSNLPSGAAFAGTVRAPGMQLDIFTYDESYLDDSDVVQRMVPAKKVWVGSTQARAARHYGAIQDLEFDGLASVRWFPKSWEEKDPSIRWVMLQSAPLPCLHQPDAFLSAQVLS